jgi:ADP-L-glycero-D-manno-heptose 6-epimerase
VIVVTGAAGFIGSNIVADLLAQRHDEVAVIDWFGDGEKWRNLAKHHVAAFAFPEEAAEFLDVNAERIKAVIHMGAVSATTERDVDRLVRLNIRDTVALWDWCAAHSVPLIYASSAATYGGLDQGLIDDDSPSAISALRPLNAYGWSKKAVDEILVNRIAAGAKAPPQWVGLKFFNVYGPNEYHKGDMKSVAVKIFDAVRDGAPVRLFKSHRDGIAHGEQRRDFIYVKDCSRVILWFLANPEISGIFNIGTGAARSFLDIAKALGKALGKTLEIEFIDMPEMLRDRYQYFTQAQMGKLRGRGYDQPFTSLEDGIADYVQAYLAREDRYR